MPGPRKINKGTRLSGIPADGWNGFVDTHRIVSQMRPPTNGAAQIAADDRAIVVTLQNDSEGDVPRGGVLKLGAPIVEPSTRAAVVLEGILFGGDTPEADNNEQQIGIALAPVADGEVGPFAVVGVVWAKLNITDEAHTFAKPKASTAELESSASTGFPVIWKEAGTGSKWAVVSLQGGSGSSLQLFRSTTTISAATGLLAANRGTGTVQPINNVTGADDGDPISISNPGFDAFAENSIGQMNKDTAPPLIVSVFCTEIPPEALPE